MKLTVSTEIALPREKVAQLLADPAHLLQQHQQDFKAFAEQDADVRDAKD